jgi:hypothetical protein
MAIIKKGVLNNLTREKLGIATSKLVCNPNRYESSSGDVHDVRNSRRRASDTNNDS